MKKPNFFIIGAPKCSTTSWAAWLSQHPEIFFSTYKEPHFFNFDEPNYHFVSSLADYESLFSGANDAHKAIGEGSTFYLFSEVAVQNILSYCPSAKFIICVRNPVEMAYALHGEMVWTGEENVFDFKKAWELNSERMKGLSVTKWAKAPSHLAYGESCKLGKQVQRVFDTVNSENIHVIVLDDIKKNPRDEYRKVLKFLNVSDDGFNDFTPRNTSKTLRSPMLMESMRIIGAVKNRLGIKKGFGVANSLMMHSRSGGPRKPLSDDMRIILEDHFKDDVRLLSNILGRDLMHWVRP